MCNTCGCHLFFPLTIPPLLPPLVFLIISSDTRYSGNFTLLYLRDGWMVESCFLGWYSANRLADGLNRRCLHWGNLGKVAQMFFFYNDFVDTCTVYLSVREDKIYGSGIWETSYLSTSATGPTKYPKKYYYCMFKAILFSQYWDCSPIVPQ